VDERPGLKVVDPIHAAACHLNDIPSGFAAAAKP
jgi:hypothetical protein